MSAQENAAQLRELGEQKLAAALKLKDGGVKAYQVRQKLAQLETIEAQLVRLEQQLAQAQRAVALLKARIGELAVTRPIVGSDMLALKVDEVES